MQLRLYLAILRRFWVLVVALPLIVGTVSLLLAWQQPTRYGSTARVIITQTPHYQEADMILPDYNLVTSWQSSEYILDDVPQVVSSMALAEDVSVWLAAQGFVVDPAAIQGSLSGEVFHRAVTIASNTDTPELADRMIEGAIVSLKANGLHYWGRAPEDGTGLQVAVLDPASGASPLTSTRQRLLPVVLRTGLALAAGVGLAFLLHYLDDRVRDRRQAEEWVGLPVMATIPEE